MQEPLSCLPKRLLKFAVCLLKGEADIFDHVRANTEETF
jgi:hypothetical protein